MDFWISEWISGFHSGFLDFSLDFWISVWISVNGVRDFFRDGPLVTQGVVTYMSPVEAFATAIKFFDQQKVCLIA